MLTAMVASFCGGLLRLSLAWPEEGLICHGLMHEHTVLSASLLPSGEAPGAFASRPEAENATSVSPCCCAEWMFRIGVL